ncbi:MAG: RsiV family protein [Clostridiales bacterium]|jgi:hypothetical protein|nr:RsiV family protein [Clostridiales bacterium]
MKKTAGILILIMVIMVLYASVSACAYVNGAKLLPTPDVTAATARPRSETPASPTREQGAFVIATATPAASPTELFPETTPLDATQTAEDIQQKTMIPAIAAEAPEPGLAADTNFQAQSGQETVAAEGTPGYSFEQFVLEKLGLENSEYPVEVKITYLSGELLSSIVEVSRNGYMDITTYTAELPTGRKCVISDFFSSSDMEWRGLIPDLVTDDAINRGMTLLGPVPPINDGQQFFIQDDTIVLLYRPYEVTTYEAGVPCFALDLNRLSDYIIGAYGIGSQG